MARTAADFMAEALQKAGVRRVYGVVGDSLNGFTDALRRIKSIDWIHMRHEEAAAFAAGAEAHITGELAVCAGSCGPGNLHLINGLYDCHRSRVPVLAIAAHIPSREIGIDYFQATHPERLFTTSSWCRPPSSCRRSSSAPCAPRSAGAVSPWSSFLVTWRSHRSTRPRLLGSPLPSLCCARAIATWNGWRRCSMTRARSRSSAASAAPVRMPK